MADGPSATVPPAAAAAASAAAVPPPAASQPRPSSAAPAGAVVPPPAPAGSGGGGRSDGCGGSSSADGAVASVRSPPPPPPASQPGGKRRGRAAAAAAASAAAVVDLPFDPARFTRSLPLYGVRIAAARCHATRASLASHVLRLPRVANVVRHPGTGEVTLLTRYQANDAGGGAAEGGRGGGGAAPPAPDVTVNGTAATGTDGGGHADGGGGDPPAASRPTGNISSEFVGAPAALLDILNMPPRSAAAPPPQALPASALVVESVTLTYAHLPADAVLRALLPSGVIPPSAFETIGHVVHLNLRAPQLPYRHLIGAVLLDKLRPRIRTVVNKTAATGGPFRTFAHEVIAGDDDMAATVVENGCTYAVAVGAVYWNSRLEGEHRRLVAAVPSGGVLVDACAGVGPFVVPVGKALGGGVALACDLNGESVRLCRANVRRNGVAGRVAVDGPRDGGAWLADLGAGGVFFDVLILNMPSGAPELLGCIRRVSAVVYGYPPAGAGDSATSGDGNGGRPLLPGATARMVRQVAPNKVHVCVTFVLPRAVAFDTS
ncbi:hypothetical protein I4F81_010852 [Pyropia yezoensis]|uniref:Uncharacterized protein n=1 Tax=Pyropia yezoensis TaxID=2788 RepID=A0ACC3CF21_PYRYE|nr:hypothetical protein I4F81_010852 [Neopyropia yezoensis]